MADPQVTAKYKELSREKKETINAIRDQKKHLGEVKVYIRKLTHEARVLRDQLKSLRKELTTEREDSAAA